MGVPKSVCEYYKNRPVGQAVDALCENLAGNETPEMDWQEARNYSKALLLAAQVRADYIDFLFDVWENSYGRVQPERLGGAHFEWNGYSPIQIWRNGALAHAYYRQGNVDEGGRSDILGVELDHKGALHLFVGRYDANGDIVDLGEIEAPEGWQVRHYDGDGDYLVNEAVSIVDLCEDSASAFERFAQEAASIVEFLVMN